MSKVAPGPMVMRPVTSASGASAAHSGRRADAEWQKRYQQPDDHQAEQDHRYGEGGQRQAWPDMAAIETDGVEKPHHGDDDRIEHEEESANATHW